MIGRFLETAAPYFLGRILEGCLLAGVVGLAFGTFALFPHIVLAYTFTVGVVRWRRFVRSGKEARLRAMFEAQDERLARILKGEEEQG